MALAVERLAGFDVVHVIERPHKVHDTALRLVVGGREGGIGREHLHLLLGDEVVLVERLDEPAPDALVGLLRDGTHRAADGFGVHGRRALEEVLHAVGLAVAAEGPCGRDDVHAGVLQAHESPRDVLPRLHAADANDDATQHTDRQHDDGPAKVDEHETHQCRSEPSEQHRKVAVDVGSSATRVLGNREVDLVL